LHVVIVADGSTNEDQCHETLDLNTSPDGKPGSRSSEALAVPPLVAIFDCDPWHIDKLSC